MISNVSFGQKMGVFDSAADVMNKPQSYAKPNATEVKGDSVDISGKEPKKKKHTAAKVIGGLAATAVVVAGLLVAGNKTGFLKNIGKYIPDGIKNCEKLDFLKEPTKEGLKILDGAGEWLASKGKVAVDAVTGLFKKGEAAAQETVA